MKASSKAALLSALVFPGVGQMYLKRYLRGLIPMGIVLTGLGVLITRATLRALEVLDKIQATGGAMDMNVASNLAVASAASSDPYSSFIVLVIFCCWLFSIIDAYMLGKDRAQ